MKKWLYSALFIGVLIYIRIHSTPYAGSTAGAGQDQRALVSGYRYSPLRQGPASAEYGRARYYQGRVLNDSPSRERYYKRYRYIEEDPNPSTVHSRK